MKKINVVYWNKPNFGDQLGPYIISKLSGCKIQYKRGPVSLKYNLKEIIKCIFSLKFATIKEMLFFWQKNILSVGSIINLGNKKSLIWGSGFMNVNQKCNGGFFYAVRGEYTNKKLISDGFKGCTTFGDPALLLPLIYHPIKLNKKCITIGIIPHFSEFDYFKEKYSNDFCVIDLNTYNIEKIIDQIFNCDYVLSTSLHGIIVSHAYNIPCIWIKKGYIHTDGIKFKDYFSSVGLPFYGGFENIEQILYSQTECLKFIKKNLDLALPQISLSRIQRDLLLAAPFALKKDYINILC